MSDWDCTLELKPTCIKRCSRSQHRQSQHEQATRITGWGRQATLPNDVWVRFHNLVVGIQWLGTHGAMRRRVLEPNALACYQPGVIRAGARLHLCRREMLKKKLRKWNLTLNLAPVIFSAMWMAVSVWRVSGPHSSRDSPSANAMKIIIWSCA